MLTAGVLLGLSSIPVSAQEVSQKSKDIAAAIRKAAIDQRGRVPENKDKSAKRPMTSKERVERDDSRRADMVRLAQSGKLVDAKKVWHVNGKRREDMIDRQHAAFAARNAAEAKAKMNKSGAKTPIKQGVKK